MALDVFLNTFAGNPLDRASDRRAKPEWIAEQLAAPDSLGLAMWNGRPFVEPAQNAQADGDLQTLRDHGLPAVQIRLEGDPADAVRRLP